MLQSRLVTNASKALGEIDGEYGWSREADASRCRDYLETFQRLDAGITSIASKCSKCGLCHLFRNVKTPQELQFLHKKVQFLPEPL